MKGDQIGTLTAHPSLQELSLSNWTWFRTGPFRTLLLVGRDVGDHALLEGDLLNLARHMAQVDQHPIDLNHPHERVLIQQAGQRPLGIKSARVQSLRDDARLRTGCALADPEAGT